MMRAGASTARVRHHAIRAERRAAAVPGVRNELTARCERRARDFVPCRAAVLFRLEAGEDGLRRAQRIARGVDMLTARRVAEQLGTV